jgi:cell division protein FtsB
MPRLFQRLAWVTLFCLVAVGTTAYLKSPAGIPAALQKRDQIRGIERENQKLREEVERRKALVHRLETDQDFRDKQVRERYNLQKPNEQTIYLQGNSPAAH